MNYRKLTPFFIVLLFILLGLIILGGLGLLPKVGDMGISDRVLYLEDKGLFWILFSIVVFSFLYAIISTVKINNNRVRGIESSNVLIYSNLISSALFIVMLYVITNILVALFFGIPFLIGILFMHYISHIREEYFNNTK